MKAGLGLISGVMLLLANIGCNMQPPGTSRSLGAVPMDKAFVVSRTVLSQYFAIASEEPAAGLLLSRPEEMMDKNDRLLGGTPARNLARLQLRKQGSEVVAYVEIRHERQMIASRQLGTGHTYSGVPNDPPVDETQTAKNTSWNLVRHEHERENAILNDIVNALRFSATTRPASAPTTTAPASKR